MSDAKAAMVEEAFDDLLNIGNGIDSEDEIIKSLREAYKKEAGEGMSLAIVITLKPITDSRPNPKVIYRGCFTMVEGYPKKIQVPANPHATMRTDIMALRYILRGYRYYKAPKGRIKRAYGFKKAWAENRLFKEVREDVHFLSDGALVDQIITLLEDRIFPIFRRRWGGRWMMQDS